MRDYLVYLAGPISHVTYAGATDWREHAANVLESNSRIKTLDPMRGKAYLAELTRGKTFQETWSDSACAYEGDKFPLSTQHGITWRDRWDVSRCDLVLLNFEDAEKVSIGTVMELAWANAWGKYSLSVIEGVKNPHDHGMILESSNLVVGSLEEALDLIPVILGV